MRRVLIFSVCLLAVCLAGCGNVQLKGEALTAAETSTVDAYNALQRATTQPDSGWIERAYLEENFRQWRWFVRSARKDTTWGPKLEGEQ